MLTTEAFNALLKTLEEPPPRSLFMLATTEPHKLPPTIQSRCQHFAFRLLDYSEVVSRLEEICRAEKVEADEGSLAVIAEAAAGSLRDALSLLDQAIAGCGERLSDAEVRRLLGVVPQRVRDRPRDEQRSADEQQDELDAGDERRDERRPAPGTHELVVRERSLQGQSRFGGPPPTPTRKQRGTAGASWRRSTSPAPSSSTRVPFPPDRRSSRS